MRKKDNTEDRMKNHPYGNLSIADVKKWVQDLLDRNDLAVCRALVVIFNRQTKSEQSADTVEVYNKVGFTGFDAQILSSFAKQYMSRGFLSDKQMGIARRKMKRYWKQLADVARENGKLPTSL